MDIDKLWRMNLNDYKTEVFLVCVEKGMKKNEDLIEVNLQ